MKAASIKRSARLKRVLRYLAGGSRRSTRQIMLGAEVCAVNSCVAELRANGVRVDCERVGGEWFYQLRNYQLGLSL